MDIQQMMRQAQEMQARMQALQAELAETPVEANAEGLVSVIMNAGGVLLAVDIDESLLAPEQKPRLEALLLKAHQLGKDVADATIASETGKMMEGLQLPSFASPTDGVLVDDSVDS